MSEKILLIKNGGYVSGLNTTQINLIKEKLTLQNPKYTQLKKLRKYHLATNEFLFFYDHVEKNTIKIPVGFIPDLLDLFSFEKEDIIDQRVEKKLPFKFIFKGKLRNYQKDMVDATENRTVGTLQASTGSGKSVVIVNLIEKFQQNTIILVNTLELLNQMVDNIVKFSNLKKEDIGVIGNGRWEIKPITVATLQTLSRIKEESFEIISDQFGMSILDECHIAPAETFYKVLSYLNSKRKFGFSATPQRDDGLDDVIWWSVGPKIHEVPLKEVSKNLSIPIVKKIKTNYTFPLFSADEYAYMIEDLCKNEERNNLILEHVDQYKDKQIVLLTTRTFHAENLANSLKEKNYKAEYLVSQIPHPTKRGKTKTFPKKKREEIIEGLKNKTIDIVVSTYSLFSTGIDVSGLEILILAGPTRSEVKLKQSIGRLMRKANFEKNPVIIDFRDDNVGILRNQGYSRNKFYKYLEDF
jgi:superfamily II DNA or RNA helicase